MSRLIGIVALAIFASSVTWAAPSAVAAETSPPAAPEGDWYGLVPTVVDVASVGLTLGGLVSAGTNGVGPAVGIGLVGLAAGFIVGPANHVVHGRGGRAVASASVRLLGAALTFGILSAQCPCGTGGGGDSARWTLAALPLIATMAIDDGLLARFTLPWDRSATVAVRPAVVTVAGERTLSLVGVF